MTAAELLSGLTHQGFVLAREADGIRVRPASRLSADLRQAIIANRAELLELLHVAGPSLAACVSWDPAAADVLLAKLRAEVAAVDAAFARQTPAPLANVLADALTIAAGYVANHELEARRGWDALELLRGMTVNIRRYLQNWKQTHGVGGADSTQAKPGSK